MKIRKQELNLQFLGSQVLDLCPGNESSPFIDGYLQFVSIYFDELHWCSEAFLQPDNSHEVDLDYAMEETIERLNRSVEKVQLNHLKAYWQGCFTASEHSQKMLKLAFEVCPINKAG